MQLTSYTDYSLRVLLYLATHKERLVTVSEIAEYHEVSRNHMVKVVHNLGTHKFIETVRGKAGGIRLGRKPEEINLGEVVKFTEPHMNIQECFDRETNTCKIIDDCKLMGVLYKARRGFMSALNENTLADML